MPVQYAFDPEGSPVRVSLTDPLDLEQIAQAVERLLSDPRLRAGLDVLSDHSGLESAATTELVRSIPTMLHHLGQRLGRETWLRKRRGA